MPFKSYREESRNNYGATVAEDEGLLNDSIKLGAILRIADSLEKIEQPYLNLLRDVKLLREDKERLRIRIETYEKRVAAYKGVINKMKKK